MSIKTTYEISRQLAFNIILKKLDSCTNKELGDLLEAFKESEFRNYIVRDSLPIDRYRYTIETEKDFYKDIFDDLFEK